MIKVVTHEFSDVLEKATIFKSAAYKAAISISDRRYDLIEANYKDMKAAYSTLKEAMEVLDRKVSSEIYKG